MSSRHPTWPGGDLIASTDAAVAKAGYSTACEAMASGTPMIYPPRRGFAEFRSLDRALRDWPGGVPISSRDFQGLRLEARPGTGPLGRSRPAAVPGRRRRADRSTPRGRLPESRRGTRMDGGPRMKLVIHPAVEPERFDALQAAAPEAEWVNAVDESRGDRGHARGRCPARQDHAGDARGRRSPAVGADVHGQPGTLHVPRAGGAPLRPDQHARPLRRRDRRPGDGVRALLRPQPAHVHPPAASSTGTSRPAASRRGSATRPGPGRSTPWTGRRSTCPTRRWGSSAWGRSAARSRGGRWPSGCRSAASTGSPTGSRLPRASRRSGHRRAARPARLERLRRDRRTPDARDHRLIRRRDAGPPAALELPDQHRAGGDRRARRPGRRPASRHAWPGRRSTSTRSSRFPPITRSGTSPT